MTDRTHVGGALACAMVGILITFGGVPEAAALVLTFLFGVLCVVHRQRVGMILWSAVAFSAPLNGVRVAPVLTLSDFLLVLALGVSLPDVLNDLLRRERPMVVPAALPACLAILVCGGLVATFIATSPLTSVANIVKLVFAAGGSVLAVALWNPGRGALLRFAWLWYAGATVNAVYALLTPRSALVGRAQGFSTHPNHLGLVCTLATGLGLGLALSSRGRTRIVALVGVMVLVGAVGASGSRAALIGEVVTIGSAAMLTRRPRILVGTGIAVAIVGTSAALGVVRIPDSSALSRLQGGGGSSASNAERQQNISTSIALYSAHPLTGAGFEFAIEAHNIYLQALVIAGPLGLAALVWAAASIVGAGLKGVRRAKVPREGLLLAGLTAGYLGYLISGVFDNIVWDRYLWIYVSLLLVWAASIRRVQTTTNSEDAAGKISSSMTPDI